MTHIPYPRLRPLAPVSKRLAFKLLSLCLILSLLLVGFQHIVQRSQALVDMLPPARTSALDTSRLPIDFVPNRGQVDQSIRFLAQGLGGMIAFASDQIILTLPNGTPADRAGSAEAEMRAVGDQATVRLRFIGANAAPRIQSSEQHPGIVNYFLGNDPAQWRTNIPTYGALHYEQLYPGIDLRYDGQGGRLKGTYTVAPGADPSHIRWRYDGTTHAAVDRDGNLVATLPAAQASQTAATLVEQAPIAWQMLNGERVPVSVRYTIADDRSISFALGSYDTTQPLTIDPELIYNTYVGSIGLDSGNTVAVDQAGAAYITGRTPVLPPLLNGIEVFVSKLALDQNNQVARVYTTVLGGSGDDIGNGIAVDTAGAAYVVGQTSSTNFPTSRALQNASGGDIDMFVL